MDTKTVTNKTLVCTASMKHPTSTLTVHLANGTPQRVVFTHSLSSQHHQNTITLWRRQARYTVEPSEIADRCNSIASMFMEMAVALMKRED